MLNSAQEVYQQRVKRYEALLHKQSSLANRLSSVRLIVFVAGIALTAYSFYRMSNYYLSGGLLLLTLVAFIYFVRMHTQMRRQQKYVASLAEINENALKRLKGEWKAFSVTGEEFKDQNHRYAGDLDIFGQGSLFQWINTAHTFQGRGALARTLTELPENPVKIRERQTAIEELAANLAWRQRYEAEGLAAADTKRSPEPLVRWAKAQNPFYHQAWVKVVFRVLPILTIISVILYLSPIKLPYYWPLAGLILQRILLSVSGKERSKVLSGVYQYEESIRAYQQMLKRFENKRFSSSLLTNLQTSLRNKGGLAAFRQIDRLAKIVESISNRDNAMFILVNILTLWDYQCMIALENWKLQSGRLLNNWISVVGEVESLASLAQIHYDNPDWVIPQIVENRPGLSAKGMGHPLLTTGRVANDLQLGYPAGILLITGSNMSGKSTLLRTAGINLVLAYAGAPVCATEFKCSVLNIFTCMRVSDNLEQNISSFYAELLRIKQVVQAAKDEGNSFFLLDEIFKGTNSIDRHMGAKVVIKQLGKHKAIGMVSTHDLDLGELERESGGKVKNYHFREGYRNDQIYFDYKLRPGLSTTRNAMFLIKLAGIEFDEQE